MNLSAITFDPEVWGTVSDWLMVAVTMVTAYYLYRTLQSQKDVQKLQSRLFEIEHIRFRESLKPVLKYTASTEVFTPSEGKAKILTIYVTNESDGIALDISKILDTEGSRTVQLFTPTGYSDFKKFLAKGDQPMMFHFDIKDPNHSFAIFAITYKDIAGTTYKQSVFCHCDRHGIELNPSLPIVIS